MIAATEQLLLAQLNPTEEGEALSVTAENIAVTAGIAKTAFYEHFSNRTEVISALLDRYLVDRADASRRLLDPANAEALGYQCAPDIFDALVDGYAASIADKPVYRHLWVEREQSAADRERDLAQEGQVFGAILDLMSELGFIGEATPALQFELITYWSVADRLVNDAFTGQEGKRDAVPDPCTIAAVKRIIRICCEHPSSELHRSAR